MAVPAQPAPAAAEFLYLSQEDVLACGVLDMPRAMAVVAQAMMLWQQGRCRQPEKVVLRPEDDPGSEARGRMNFLCAQIGPPVSALGMKWIASFPANRARALPRASALVVLNSPETGLPLAVLDGTLISAVRTGAVTGLGARYLAPAKVRKIGVVGAGVQAHTQILGLATALPEVAEIAVVNRDAAPAIALAEDCQRRWGLPVRAAGSVAEALEDAQVALTITTAAAPLLQARYIAPGALTVQMSGHECEFELVRQCQKLVCDSWEAVRHRGIMTPALMHAAGQLPAGAIHAQLGELLLGAKTGREHDGERIHFFHMGMGVEDVALAWDIYQRAGEHDRGRRLRLWDQPLWI
ncbi:MAG: ornithine cyclodeaminase family protein [Terriglobales bacterium]